MCSYAAQGGPGRRHTGKDGNMPSHGQEEVGAWGIRSALRIPEDFISSLCHSVQAIYDHILRTFLKKSTMLSADVNPAVDPNYSDVQDKKNASYFGRAL